MGRQLTRTPFLATLGIQQGSNSHVWDVNAPVCQSRELPQSIGIESRESRDFCLREAIALRCVRAAFRHAVGSPLGSQTQHAFCKELHLGANAYRRAYLPTMRGEVVVVDCDISATKIAMPKPMQIHVSRHVCRGIKKMFSHVQILIL